MSSLIVFDIDNTLAMTEEPILEAFYRGAYDFMSREGLLEGMAFEPFMETSHERYTNHGCSVRYWGNQFGKDLDWVVECYKFSAPYLVDAVRPHMTPDAALRDKLLTLQKQGHTLVAFTQAHRNYSLKLMKILNLDDIFTPERLHDIESVKGRLKRSEDAYRYILNHHADHVFLHHHMVEDTPANLGPAKRLGFTTWMVGPKTPKPEDLAMIDHKHADIHGVLDAMLAA